MKESKWSATHIRAVSLLLLIGALSNDSSAAPGDVDLSFDPETLGINGRVSTVVVQPDGKLLIGGIFTSVRGLLRTNVARLNADGSGDPTFNPSVKSDEVSSLALQSDGKVLVGGYFSTYVYDPTNGAEYVAYSHVLTRLNGNGTRDAGFEESTGAVGETNTFVYAVAVQPDGKILVGGYFSEFKGTNRHEIARLNSNGSLDASFNPGAGVGSSAGYPGRVNSIVVQSDGKVLIGGYFFTFDGTNRNGIARLNANGTLDTSFSFTQAQASVSSMALQPNGKVVIGGGITVNGTNHNTIARLNADGSLDSDFNPTTYGYPNGGVTSVVVQSDGKVVIGGGFIAVNSVGRNRIARLNADGSLDGSFNPDIGPGNFFGVWAVGLQSDGKLLIGGDFTTIRGQSRKAIARLNADGSLDVSFHPGMSVGASSVVVQPDGKVLVGDVFTFINGTNRYASTRLNANGSLDSTFISDTNFRPNLIELNFDDCGPQSCGCEKYVVPFVLLTQPDGKVLIGVQTETFIYCPDGGGGVFYSHVLARLNADGGLDGSFYPGPGWSAYAGISRALAVQPNGKVIVGGSFGSINGTNRYGIARLNANGSLDGSFQNGMSGVRNAGGYSGRIEAVAVQPDGKVLIGGLFTTVNGTNRNNIARLNANGSLDSSFNPGTGTAGAVRAVALQPDGKVLIGGDFTSVNGTNRSRMARLNSNGSLDSSFNPGTGPNAKVSSIALQPDGKVLIGGDFTTVNGVVRLQVARLYGDFFAPSLSIARSNAFVIVSWPVTGLNFQLQENTDLSLPNSWSPVAQPAVTNGNQVSSTIPATAVRMFFRLKSQ